MKHFTVAEKKFALLKSFEIINKLLTEGVINPKQAEVIKNRNIETIENWQKQTI